MKGKKFLAFSLTVAMLAGGALSVSAAGVSDVFSAGYYADKYSDLKAAYGSDEEALLQHFMTSGAKEGRVMSPILDVAKYRAAYPDLNASFGDNWDAYVDHYLSYGIKEGRKEGVLFDLIDYAAKNPDVKAAYGDNYSYIARHYVTFGMKEGRKGGDLAVAVAQAVSSNSAASNNSGSNSGSNAGSNTGNSSTGNTTQTTPTTPATSGIATNHEHAHGADKVKLGLASVEGRAEATCYTEGYVEYRCLEPIWTIVDGKWVQLTYEDPDTHTLIPQVCGVIWRETTAKEHVKPENGNIAYKAPTCNAAGYERFVCERCHQTVENTLPQLVGHNFDLNNGAKLLKETVSTGCATSERGYKLIKCAGCETTYTDYKPALEHDIQMFPHWDKKPTCTETGISYGYCNRCQEKVTRVEPMIKHEWVNTTTARSNAYTRTEQQAGQTVFTVGHTEWTLDYCEACGEILQGSVIKGATNGCEDADKDGLCDVCQLRMDRNPIEDEAFVYTPGRDKFTGLTKN